MTKSEPYRDFLTVVGASHSGKYVLLNIFQKERRFGISVLPCWVDDIIIKFYKDVFNRELKSTRMVAEISELDTFLLYNTVLDNRITNFFKHDDQNAFCYYLIVNNQFKLNTPRLSSNNNNFVCLVRDPRILWIVDRSTRNKNDENFKNYFLKGINEYTELYKNHLIHRAKKTIIRFEDLYKDFEGVINRQIFDNFFPGRINKSIEIPRCSQRVNQFFTTNDRDENQWFGYKDQEKFDMISEECKEYIQLFNYKPRLTVEEIYDGV